MGARRRKGAHIAGHQTWVLENDALRVLVAPALGGRILELFDKVAGRDLFWHNPRTEPRYAPYGAHFDDWWSGGWDEIFPSGDRGWLHGEPLPYMGELWCVPWAATEIEEGDATGLLTVAHGTVAPARFERRVVLSGDEPVLRLEYRIENLDIRPLPFTWGIHPVFAVETGYRIDHPGSDMLVGVTSDASVGVEGSRYRWPMLPDPTAPGGVRDMRRVRAREDGVFAGHWATDLPEGWLALTNPSTRRGIVLLFPTYVFPHAWLWQVYGGWRGHHHVALEPWTSHPQQLDEAIAAGGARMLGVGETLEASVEAVLFGDLEGVTRVERSGADVRIS